jgi:hypothetical protein
LVLVLIYLSIPNKIEATGNGFLKLRHLLASHMLQLKAIVL